MQFMYFILRDDFYFENPFIVSGENTWFSNRIGFLFLNLCLGLVSLIGHFALALLLSMFLNPSVL